MGAAADTAVGELPVLLYGTASSWPDNGVTDTRALNDALSYISCQLSLIYDKTSRCYKPSFPNVRAEYCTDAVSDWNLAIQTPSPGTYCNLSCDENCVDAVPQVLEQLRTEQTKLKELYQSTTQYAGLYNANLNQTVIFDLKGWVNTVLDEVGTPGANPVSGYWTGLLSNAVSVFSYFSGDDLNPIIGILGALGQVAADVMVGSDGAPDLGQIVETTAEQLPDQLNNTYVAASNQIATAAEIIATDWKKLENSPFQEVDQQTLELISDKMEAGTRRFVYGRLLASAYTVYGVLPDSENPDYPLDFDTGKVSYQCKYGGPYVYVTNHPFKDFLWPYNLIGVTQPNDYPLPAYGGSPNVLALGNGSAITEITPAPEGVMDVVITPLGKPGPYPSPYPPVSPTTNKQPSPLGEWPVWFYRHNFPQFGYDCENLP